MRFFIEEVEVFFPYPYIYPEQYKYMVELKKALDARGHCVLEMPSGTGKTITLLSFITSYQLKHPEAGKLVYCTRTVPEMEKTLEELRRFIKFRDSEIGAQPFLAMGLSARKNMCINESVNQEYDGGAVDAKCRSRTASWVREAAQSNPSIETCPFFEGLEATGSAAIVPSGVYTLAELRRLGRELGWCPYFLARHLMNSANVVVYSYQYLLDPKIAGLVSGKLSKDCIVVFDEAHNIDNVCIEALSVNINNQILDSAERNIVRLDKAIAECRARDADRLNQEYQRLVQGLAASGLGAGRSEDFFASPVLPDDVVRESVPGNIRRAEFFLHFMRRLHKYIRSRLLVKKVVSETPVTTLEHMQKESQMEARSLKFCSERLASLFQTLQVADVHELSPLRVVADFGTLLGTYNEGFIVMIQPFDDKTNIENPVLQLSCLDASLAMKPVFSKFKSVVITSGTLSPLSMYPKILNFQPSIAKSFEMTLTRQCICPMIVTKGSDQVPISSAYSAREDPSVIRNYGNLLVELSSSVPDGIICFFTSYQYMEEIVSQWHEMQLLQMIQSNKLLFIETPSTAETALALDNYRKACDSGRGAVFLSIARGKVAEGIDFDGHYGRAVVMFGIPFVYTENLVLKQRLVYLEKRFQIPQAEFLSFDAIRQAAQCIGRVIRNKTDYGLMILADRRYMRADKKSKLPKWIQECIKDSTSDLSTDVSVALAKNFLREMAQPWNKDDQFGESLWTQADVEKQSRPDRDMSEPLPPAVAVLAAPIAQPSNPWEQPLIIPHGEPLGDDDSME